MTVDSVVTIPHNVQQFGPPTHRQRPAVPQLRDDPHCTALGRTLDGGVGRALLEQVRTVQRASTADYFTERGDLAAEAGQLAGVFREPTLQERFDQAGRELLFVLGMCLLYPAHRRGPRPGVRF
ncbi:hypothetical protein [Streptomyces sp. CNZ748]|uniref:hypothetical protein n=1 Tax=Streptomyces sp. CNZ748 TaxID=2885160 RepID=UPI001E421DE6|nr:hypothetical protein [Streptomyces sp. CNZ748]